MGSTWGPLEDIIYGMSGHYLGHVWALSGAVYDIRGATCISDAVFQTLPGVFYRLDSGPVQGSTCRS